MRRILAIAVNTFREAARNKILYSLLFFAVLLIASALALGQLALNEEVRMIRDVGLYGIDIFGVVIAIFVGVNLLYKELDLKTVYTILPKPIHRWEFVLGKWLGMLLTLGIQMAVMGVVLVITLALQGAPADSAIAKAVWLLFVNVMVMTSVALLFSSFSSPFLSGFFTFGIFIVGRSIPDLELFGRKAGGAVQTITSVMSATLPNLHLFYPSGAIIGAREVSIHRQFVDVGYVVNTTMYGVGYALVTLLLAMIVFSRRDFV